MKPLILQGHTRPLTFLRYNEEGDLLFSCAKDRIPTIWDTATGERIGTYSGTEGHQGAINCLDIDLHSTRLLSGGADGKVKFWDVSNGIALKTWDTKSPVVSCGLSDDGQSFFALTIAAGFGYKEPRLMIFDIKQSAPMVSQVLSDASGTEFRANHGFFTGLSKEIVCACEDGSVRKFDVESGKEKQVLMNLHSANIKRCSQSRDRQCFVTASSDKTAKLLDTESFSVIRTFEVDKPLNSADISNDKTRIIVAGGQEASQVTTTSAKAGKFEMHLFNAVVASEIGTIGGHFGPVNAVAMSPDNTGFASGGEDGIIRLHRWDPEYYKLE
eukprot:ANDGO_01058.mRNA.1 Eukaryotic translation initiation factor 3 subunit I